MILAGTNKEKEAITKQVREGLIEQEKLSKESRNIDILKPKDLDKFSLTQASSYEVGDVIKFGHNTARFNKDVYYRVDAIDSQTKTLNLRDSLGNKQDLELNTYKDRTVFRISDLRTPPGRTDEVHPQSLIRIKRSRLTGSSSQYLALILVDILK